MVFITVVASTLNFMCAHGALRDLKHKEIFWGVGSCIQSFRAVDLYLSALFFLKLWKIIMLLLSGRMDFQVLST